MDERLIIIIAFLVFATIFIICDTYRKVKNREMEFFWENYQKFQEEELKRRSEAPKKACVAPKKACVKPKQVCEKKVGK